MVLLPMGSDESTADFAVVAKTAAPEGWDECEASFIDSVEILENQAHNELNITVINKGQEAKKEPNMSFPTTTIQVEEKNTTSTGYAAELRSDLVTITYKSLQVTIHLQKVPTTEEKPPFTYFDIEIAGLLQLTAGGILGQDPHSWVQSKPAGCEKAVKHFAPKVFSTAKAV